MIRTTAALALAMALTGCFDDESRLDASSLEAYKTSLAEIKGGLVAEKRKALDAALATITMLRGQDEFLADPEEISDRVLLLGVIFTAADIVNSVGEVIHGKTAHEILRLAKKKELKRLSIQFNTLQNKMHVLPLLSEMYAREQAELDHTTSRLKIKDASYYWETGPDGKRAMVFLSITNNLPITTTKIFFHGVLKIPGRSAPLVEADFTSSIRLEPGEWDIATLVFNQSSVWANQVLADLENTTLTVRAIDAMDTRGDLLSAGILNLQDEFEKLKETRNNLQEKRDSFRVELADDLDFQDELEEIEKTRNEMEEEFVHLKAANADELRDGERAAFVSGLAAGHCQRHSFSTADNSLESFCKRLQ